MNMANMPPSITSTLAHCGHMYSGIFGYGRGKGSTRAQIDGHQSSKLPIQFEEVNANLIRKPGARIWHKVWVFSSVASLARWLRAIR